MTAHATETPRQTPSRLVAAELRAEMGRQGVTGRELARRLHRDSAWVSRHIGVKAAQAMTLDEVVECTEALGISPERFLGALLPRLDSNQQPSGYQQLQVSAPVVDLFTGLRVA